jgi:hypothetical protein
MLSLPLWCFRGYFPNLFRPTCLFTRIPSWRNGCPYLLLGHSLPMLILRSETSLDCRWRIVHDSFVFTFIFILILILVFIVVLPLAPLLILVLPFVLPFILLPVFILVFVLVSFL